MAARIIAEVDSVNLSAQIEVQNEANFARILRGFLKQYGIDPDELTNAEELEAMLKLFKHHARDAAKANEANNAAETARDDAINDFPPPEDNI
jgi:hypothetical protein